MDFLRARIRSVCCGLLGLCSDQELAVGELRDTDLATKDGLMKGTLVRLDLSCVYFG